jgi:PAS domain S-box-containing protein
MDNEVLIDSSIYHMIASTTNSKGVIVDVNDDLCKISGYTRDEMIGKSHRILRHPDMPKSIYIDLWKTIKSGKTWKGVLKNLDKYGDYYWVRATISPIYKDDGLEQFYTSIRIPIDRYTIEEYTVKYRELLIKEHLQSN